MGKKKVVNAELDGLVKRKKYLDRRLVIAKNRFKRFAEKMTDAHDTQYFIKQALEEVRLKMQEVVLSRLAPEEAQAVREEIAGFERLAALLQREDLQKSMEAAAAANAAAYKRTAEVLSGQPAAAVH